MQITGFFKSILEFLLPHRSGLGLSDFLSLFDTNLIFPFQVLPSGLCNATDDSDLYKYGWVGVVKLQTPNAHAQPCLPLFEKVLLICRNLPLVFSSFSNVFSCGQHVAIITIKVIHQTLIQEFTLLHTAQLYLCAVGNFPSYIF